MATPISQARVSQRGQTTLPAELRHRWGIEDGGQIAFIDLGEAALVLPGGMIRIKEELKRILSEQYNAGLTAIDDPDLADR